MIIAQESIGLACLITGLMMLVGPVGEEEVCKTYADGFDSRGQLSHSIQPMVSMMRPLAVLFFGI